MKHLQTFESYDPINEEEIFKFIKNKIKSWKDKYTQKFKKVMAEATKKGLIDASEIDELRDSASKKMGEDGLSKVADLVKSESPEKLAKNIPTEVQNAVETISKAQAQVEKLEESARYLSHSELILEKAGIIDKVKKAIGKICTWLGIGTTAVTFLNLFWGMISGAEGGYVISALFGKGMSLGLFAAASSGALLVAAVIFILGFLASGTPWTVYIGSETMESWKKKQK